MNEEYLKECHALKKKALNKRGEILDGYIEENGLKEGLDANYELENQLRKVDEWFVVELEKIKAKHNIDF